MMGHAAKAREQEHKARARLRVLDHYEQVTRNVSRTCRFFGISRTLFNRRRDRYRQKGLPGLHDGLAAPRYHPLQRYHNERPDRPTHAASQHPLVT
jgi:transposase-like protein